MEEGAQYPPSWSPEFNKLYLQLSSDNADTFLEIHLEKLEVILDATIKKFRKDFFTLYAILHHLQELLMLEPVIDLSIFPKLPFIPKESATNNHKQSKELSRNNQRNNLDPQFRWMLLSMMKRLGFESRMLSLLSLLQQHMESQNFQHWSFVTDLELATDLLKHSSFSETIEHTPISTLITDSTFLSDLTEQLIDMSSSIIANLCGPCGNCSNCVSHSLAAGPITKKWKFCINNTSINNNNPFLELRIKELSFAEADIGWQTWRSGILLARYNTANLIHLLMKRLLCDGSIDVSNKNVLELGCGTGMTGILCAKFGAQKITLTDYHPRVVENSSYNASLNGVSNDIADVSNLDWFDFVEGGSMGNGRFQRNSFDIILAADVVYASKHASALAQVTDFMLKLDSTSHCYFVLPTANLRDGIEEVRKNISVGLLISSV